MERLWSNKPGTMPPLTLEALRKAMADMEKPVELRPEFRFVSWAEATHYREHGCNDYLCWVKTASGCTDEDIDRALREIFGELL